MILEGYFGGGATSEPDFSHAAFGRGGLPNLKGGDHMEAPPLNLRILLRYSLGDVQKRHWGIQKGHQGVQKGHNTTDNIAKKNI